MFANPDRDIPVVPVLVNFARTPVPTPGECWAFGTLLAEFIASVRPATESVALIGAGGLSHWIGYAEPKVNEAFDLDFLAALERGDLGSWRSRSPEAIERDGGNGGLEIMNWLAVVAAVPQARPERIYYEPMLSWMTGMGGVVLHLPERPVARVAGERDVTN
jgi:hypothetical protein